MPTQMWRRTVLGSFAAVGVLTAAGHLHPMAAAMNYIGYDAAALGNHEFNDGSPLLRTFADQLDFPLLGANALDAATGLPAFAPEHRVQRAEQQHGSGRP